MEALSKKAQKSLQWLVDQKPMLRIAYNNAANRLFFNAMAFYLTGLALENKAAVDWGKEFLKDALATQNAEGVFLEANGFDSSYQGVSIFRLILVYLSMESFEGVTKDQVWQSIRKAVKREVQAILPSGEVSLKNNTRVSEGGEKFLGVEKGVDFISVYMGLQYYCALTPDPEVKAVADKVFRFYSGK